MPNLHPSSVTELDRDVGLTGSGINVSLIIGKDVSTAEAKASLIIGNDTSTAEGGEEAVGISGHAFSGRGSDSAVSRERRYGSSRIDVSDMSRRRSGICNRLVRRKTKRIDSIYTHVNERERRRIWHVLDIVVRMDKTPLAWESVGAVVLILLAQLDPWQ